MYCSFVLLTTYRILRHIVLCYLLLKGRGWVLRLFLRPGGRGSEPEEERTCSGLASSGTQLTWHTVLKNLNTFCPLISFVTRSLLLHCQQIFVNFPLYFRSKQTRCAYKDVSVIYLVSSYKFRCTVCIIRPRYIKKGSKVYTQVLYCTYFTI